jgi:hypothetical protein
MAKAVRYSDSVMVRCQPQVTALVERAALARGQKPSEYIRQALLTGLRLDGFDPAEIVPREDRASGESSLADTEPVRA